MSLSTLEEPASMVECLNAHTTLTLSGSTPAPEVPERRYLSRYKPADEVTVRLDVLGGIWSARIEDISAQSALLHVDHEVAEQISDGQPASIWLESEEAHHIRFDGQLKAFRKPPAVPADGSVPLSFICEC